MRTFKVILHFTGSNKFYVVKEIKDFTGRDLRSSKDIADNAPAQVATDLTEEKANGFASSLNGHGAMATVHEEDESIVLETPVWIPPPIVPLEERMVNTLRQVGAELFEEE